MRLWTVSDLHLEMTRGWDLPAPADRPAFDVMRNLIRNIIERLRGFIRNDAHDTTEPKVNDSTHPISDEAELDVDRGYTSTAVLTPSGILFKGIRYNSAALADMDSTRGEPVRSIPPR